MSEAPTAPPGRPSALLSRRSTIMGGLLVGIAAAAGGLKLRERVQTPLSKPLGPGIPKRFGSWAAVEGGGVVKPTEEGEEKSLYDQEVSRVYMAQDLPPVMLLIAYGSTQSDTLQVHRPEFCYPAAGFDLQPANKTFTPVAGGRTIPCSFFTATRGDRVEHILYWTRLGDQFPTSWINQHVSRVRNSARGIVPDGVLVRASVIGSEAPAARRQLQSFLSAMVQSSSPSARRGLIG